MEAKLKHLDFVQNVINRLSTNSFLLKGWCVVLISALMALGSQNANHNYIYLALFPALIFWGLDGYFLWQERIYRKFYDQVREKPEEKIDFCMNPPPLNQANESLLAAFFSPTLTLFHGVLIFSVFVVVFFESATL